MQFITVQVQYGILSVLVTLAQKYSHTHFHSFCDKKTAIQNKRQERGQLYSLHFFWDKEDKDEKSMHRAFGAQLQTQMQAQDRHTHFHFFCDENKDVHSDRRHL